MSHGTAAVCEGETLPLILLLPTPDPPPLPIPDPPPHPHRSSSEVLRRKADALTALLRYPPELFVELAGVDRFKEGTSILFEALQCSEANKQVSLVCLCVMCVGVLCVCTPKSDPSCFCCQLLFSLFDVIVLELFPELAAGNGDVGH